MLRRWWFHPAEWWQFWCPGSGFVGGAIASATIATVVIVTIWGMGW